METLLIIYLIFFHIQIVRIKNTLASLKDEKEQIPTKFEKFLYNIVLVF